MTPQELKNSILQLAVQGKLVPQRPEEGSAEELLAAIRAEKQSSDSRSTVRKKKNSHKDTQTQRDAPADEIPFEIPKTWKWGLLGECCEMFTGNSISEHEKKMKYAGRMDGYDYIGTKDVSFSQTIAYDNGVRIPESSAFKIARKNSILMCIEGGSAGRKIGILDRDVCFGNKLCMFAPSKLDNRFLFYYLQSPEFKSFFSENLSGIIGGVSIKKLKEIPFPLPPLAEQKRIVAKIEELLPLCERYGNAYNELQVLNKRVPGDLQKSLLQLAVQGKLVPQRPEEGSAEELLATIRAQKQSSDSRSSVRKKKSSHKDTETQSDVPADEIPFEIPKTWKWVRLGEIAFSCLGKMLDRQKNIGIPMPYLRNVNVRWGSFDLSDLLEMKFENVTEKRFLVKKGDLVMCEGGEPGRCAIWESEDAIHFQKALHRIRFQECVDVYFSYRIFEFYAKSGFLNNLFTGTTIKHLTGQVLKEIPFPLPPLAEQKRIVAKLEELLPLCEQLSLR